jgi:hypothetical protein
VQGILIQSDLSKGNDGQNPTVRPRVERREKNHRRFGHDLY